MATSITKKPQKSVSNLTAPARQSGSRKMKATWKVPADLVKASSKSRATDLEIDWIIDIPGKDPKKVTKTGNEKLTSSEINLDSLTIGKTKYNRGSFYPLNSSRYLWGVSIKVIPYNKKGKGKAVTTTRKFTVPRAPTIDNFSFNGANGEISTNINTDAGSDHRERYDTRYQLYIRDTKTGYNRNLYDASGTSTSIPLTYDAYNYQALTYDQYIQVRVTAWARGYAGDSGKVSREYFISYPAKATITGVSVSEKSSTGKATIYLNTNSTREHPVDQVKLEYIANTKYKTAAEIPADASRTETDITDDAQCSALTMPVANLIPDRGKTTWVRVKSWHAAENVLYRYSDWVRLTGLETPAPTAEDDVVEILSAVAGSDGESAIVQLGWNADGQDDSTGTELTWSDAEDAWKSTEAPSEHIFSWSDGKIYQKTKDQTVITGKVYYERSGEGTPEDPYVYTPVASPQQSTLYTYYEVAYNDSATITIKGLSEATKYYIKARRYLEDEETTYSPYSNTATVLTSEKPETVVASCDRYIPTGKSLSVYWTYSGNGIQTEWRIIDSNGTVLTNGEGSYGSTQISSDRLAAFAVNNEITFVVEISTGSGYVTSEENTVVIIDSPTMDINVAPTLTAQPLSFGVVVSSLCDLIVIVTSQGAAGQRPEGFKRQTFGDTIFSDVITPLWEEENDQFTATITLPGGMDFWDLGGYIVSVTAVDRLTGLRSDEHVATCEIAWAHQAPDPIEAVTLTPIDEVDEEGFHRMAVQIDLTPPDGSMETDVYDIYRKTGDGAVLIGEGFPLTYTTFDEYAPFAEDLTLEYRIAIRTIDGDVEFADIEYEAPCSSLRFDWESGFLELPYNLSIGDTYKKDVDIRQHMDGSVDGYWNPNITRTGKLSTDVIKLQQQNEIEQARQLARYAGPVFIRTPEGSAYEADVQVSDMSSSNKKIMAIAIDATETGLTQEFILPIPHKLEDEETE